MRKDINAYALTHRGKVRKQNEDSYFLSGYVYPVVAVVADGMGGHAGGKLASSLAVECFTKMLSKTDIYELTVKQLKSMMEYTSKLIWDKAQSEKGLENMGTTMTAAIVTESKVMIGQVGDSRAYILRNGKLDRLTVDHSYVQFLVEKGILTPEEAETHPYKNIITRAIGMETVTADVYVTKFAPGNMILLCTDGLSNTVSQEELESILMAQDQPKQKCMKLKNLTLDRGATDNFSVVLLENGGVGNA